MTLKSSKFCLILISTLLICVFTSTLSKRKMLKRTTSFECPKETKEYNLITEDINKELNSSNKPITHFKNSNYIITSFILCFPQDKYEFYEENKNKSNLTYTSYKLVIPNIKFIIKYTKYVFMFDDKNKTRTGKLSLSYIVKTTKTSVNTEDILDFSSSYNSSNKITIDNLNFFDEKDIINNKTDPDSKKWLIIDGVEDILNSPGNKSSLYKNYFIPFFKIYNENQLISKEGGIIKHVTISKKTPEINVISRVNPSAYKYKKITGLSNFHAHPDVDKYFDYEDKRLDVQKHQFKHTMKKRKF